MLVYFLRKRCFGYISRQTNDIYKLDKESEVFLGKLNSGSPNKVHKKQLLQIGVFKDWT